MLVAFIFDWVIRHSLQYKGMMIGRVTIRRWSLIHGWSWYGLINVGTGTMSTCSPQGLRPYLLMIIYSFAFRVMISNTLRRLEWRTDYMHMDMYVYVYVHYVYYVCVYISLKMSSNNTVISLSCVSCFHSSGKCYKTRTKITFKSMKCS